MTNRSLMRVVTDLITRLEAGTLTEGFRQRLQRGSAKGLVGIISDPRDPAQLIMVVRFEIMPGASQDREAFFLQLLTLNHRLHGRASFSLDDEGTVHLSSGRPLEDLDPGEIVDMILWTSEQADHFDDLLMEAFPSPDASR
ncbi:MAG: hypothetical protein P8188_15040 [Gemmatimonadota bacterium]|jgi:hypothetical protein